MLDPPGRDEESRGTRWQRLAVVCVVLGVGLLLFLLVSEELRLVRDELRADRWRVKCENEDHREACGRWALHLIQRGTTFEQLRDGLAGWEELCAEQKVHRACRYTAELRSERGLEKWFDGHPFESERVRVATRACKDGDARGCLVVAGLGRPDDSLAARVESMCANGDAIACLTWTRVHDGAASRKAACDAGFSAHCGDGPSEGCLGGDFESCRRSEDMMEQSLAGLAAHVATNPGLLMQAPEGDVPPDACADGSAAACFATGLQRTANVDPFEDPVPVASLEPTMGRACALGADVACEVYALRLLDHRTPTKQHRRRAGELLDTACERGHRPSCWLAATTSGDPSEELDRYRAAARQMCEDGEGSAACRPWIHVLAYDIGAEPWLIAESDAYARMRASCWTAGSPESCHEAAQMMLHFVDAPNEGAPPLFVQASELAEDACSNGDSLDTCHALSDFAEFQQHYGRRSPEQLRTQVCEKLPHLCQSDSR